MEDFGNWLVSLGIPPWGWIVIGLLLIWLASSFFTKRPPAVQSRGDPVEFSRGVVFKAPEARPLSPEFRPYVQRLVAIYKRDGGFHAKEVGDIGAEINEKFRYHGMVEVCDGLRPILGANAHRSLERRWDGIGEWQS